jgi:hypothetical protein
MGWYVHLHVCFSCCENEPVAVLAKKHLENTKVETEEARWFLEDAAERTGENPGPKGGLFLWGIVGNHTNVEQFVEDLLLFWRDLYDEGAVFSFERIIVFEEQEQSEQAKAHEISFIEKVDNSNLPYGVVVKKYDCQFTWMQH